MTTFSKLKGTNRRITGWGGIKIILALIFFVYILSKTDYEQLLALKDLFSWQWFGITLLIFLLGLATKTLQYYILLGRKLSYARTMEVVVVQNALMNFVATAAGIASYLAMLGVEKDVRLGKATISFVLVKIGDIIAVLCLFFISVFFLQPLSADLMPVVLFIRIFSVFFFAFLLGAVFFRQKFAVAVQKITAFLKIKDLKVVQKGISFLDEIVKYDQSKMLRTILMASFISLVYMTLTMFWGYTRFRVFSFPIQFFIIVFIFSLLQFASWVPIFVLGGLGVSEGITIYLLGLFGLHGAGLAAILIGIRVVIYLLNALTILILPLKPLFLRE